jgi:hypothetical protein
LGETLKALVLVGGLAVGLFALATIFGPPPTGISESRAVQIAKREVFSTSPLQLTVARRGQLREFRDGASDAAAPPNRWVWAVVLSGSFPPASCGPAPHPGQLRHYCPRPVHSALVVIDYVSGDFVMTSEPSPIPLGIRLGA